MALSFFPTAEGFYDYRKKQYIYQYKDHLGNVRLSYGRNTTTNKIEILDRNDYYPFGMNFLAAGGGSVYNPQGSPFNYKYNGKELQETGMYDYGARMYMPDIGRWGVVDPLAEATPSFSPYAYALNNPIKYIDPTGMIAEDCPKCPKPSYEGQTMTGSDGKNYGAARQQGDTAWPVPTKPLEWLGQSNIEEVTITGKAKAPAAPIEIGTTSGAGFYGSQPLPSPALSYDIPLLAVPYMLLEAGVTELLTKSGMDSDNAQTTAAAATFLFTLKPSGAGRNVVNRSESSLGHIFRESSGHVNPSTITSQNRYINLFEKVGNNPQNVNSNVLSGFQKNAGGFEGFSQTFRNGKQVWTQVRNGKIINAGVNEIPK